MCAMRDRAQTPACKNPGMHLVIGFPMNRRDFIVSTAAGAVLPASSSPLLADSPAGRKRALMKLGCQSSPTSDQRLQFFARHGVQGICGYPQDSEKKGFYSVDDLSRVKERCDKYKISL